MNFSAVCTLEYVPVSDDAVGFDEEAATSRKLLAVRVESFDCNRGGFDAANQFGEKILRGSNWSWEE